VIRGLSRRERILVGVGGAAVLVVGLWLGVLQPALERGRLAAELLPAREQLLAHRQGLLARRGALMAELEATRARLETLRARFLPAATPAVAASELQKLVKDMAAQARTEVRSERILPPVERGELLEVPIEITVSGEIRQLVELLALVDRAPKLLAVQELRVRVVNVSQPRDLLVTVTVAGYILTGKTGV
jgi:type II secretory pathway component PulM